MTSQQLIEMATEVRKNAYAPYSSFTVGAALLCDDGSVYTGCNIENASFTPTCCAERVAFFSAVSDGKRAFSKLAVVGGEGENLRERCYPCGVCRQVMSEFVEGDFIVVFSDGTELSLGEILPYGFSM